MNSYFYLLGGSADSNTSVSLFLSRRLFSMSYLTPYYYITCSAIILNVYNIFFFLDLRFHNALVCAYKVILLIEINSFFFLIPYMQ